MQRRNFLRLGAAGAVSVGAASWLGTWQASAGTAVAQRVAPTTPFAVGVRQYTWMRGTRQITASVYYPATGAAGGSAVTDAPVAPGVFPVCEYTHGAGASPQGGFGQIRPLVAAGFIVPAPNFHNASIGDASKGNLPKDVSEVLTRTLALNTGSDPLAGHIDTAAGIGVSGYSMGGMTTNALLTTYPDPRITVAVPISCIRMGGPSSAVHAKVLFIHGDRDQVCPYSSAHQSYSEMPAPKGFLTFIGADHGGTGWGNTSTVAMRTMVDWMRWGLYGDLAARGRLTADATSSSSRWEFVPGSSEPPPASTYFNLVAQHSGKVAEITGASTAAGAGLAQWTSNGGQHQQFAFIDAGGGYVRIKARHSGLVLQVAGNTSGAAITQQPDTNAAGQQWRLTEQGGTVSLVNRQSGLAMDVWERSTADGARISQYAYSGNPNQRFTRRAV